jgi:hypothetical protein
MAASWPRLVTNPSMSNRTSRSTACPITHRRIGHESKLASQAPN